MIVSHPHTEAMVEIYNLGIPAYEFAYDKVKSVAATLPDCVGCGNESIVVDLDQDRVLALSRLNRSEAHSLEQKYFADILHEVLRHTSKYYSPQFLSVYSGTPSIVGSPGSIREKFTKDSDPTLKEFVEFNNWVNNMFKSMGNYGHLVHIDMQIDIFSDPPRPGPNLIKDNQGRLTYTDSVGVYNIFDAMYIPIEIDPFLDYISAEVPNIPSESLDYLRDRLEELERINYFYRCLPYQMVETEGKIEKLSNLTSAQVDDLFKSWEYWRDKFQINDDWLLDIYKPMDDQIDWEETMVNRISARMSHFSGFAEVPYYLRNVFKDGIANAQEYEDQL